MILRHLLLGVLCAHAAFFSIGDAIAALELLHQSQVKVTIKTGAQILCILSTIWHPKNSSGYRMQIITLHVPEVRDFLQGQNSKDNMSKDKCINFGSHEGTHTPT